MAYHINSKGEPGICRAKMRCRFGDAGGHYNSAAEAQLAFEAAAEAGIEKSLSNHSKKIEVHSVEADPFSLIEDPPALESGTILRAKDGTLVVISDNLTYSEFGAYMLGNLSNEPAVAKRLHQLDLDKSYQDGSCDSLSFALLESNPDVVAVDELVNENGELWHSIARHRDGSYIDSLGRWDEADLFDYWETVAEREDAGELSWRRDAHEKSASPSHDEEHNLKLLVNYLSSL